MRLIALLWLAAVSSFAARPRYGGTLVVEMRGAPKALDPLAADSPDAHRLSLLIFDRLVELDDKGVRPGLATSWTSDATQSRWTFHLRPNVKLHDGSALTPGAVAIALNTALSGCGIQANRETITIQSVLPMPGLLYELAHARASIAIRLANGTLQGSGPFRAMEWLPGEKLIVAAFDGYWAGRPYLDGVEVRLGRGLRDQLSELEAGKADVIETTPAEFRRQELRGRRAWPGATADLIALVHLRGRPAVQDTRVRQAVALAVDRGPMWNVLLQKQGETTASLLPSWMTGFGFVFANQRDPAKARELGAGQPTITLGHDPADWVLKSIAERIALNAREASLTMRLATGVDADAVLARLHSTSIDPRLTLGDYCRQLKVQTPAGASTPEGLYQAERRLLDGYWIVPLFHVPALYALQIRVRNWVPAGSLHWRLEEVWLEAAP